MFYRSETDVPLKTQRESFLVVCGSNYTEKGGLAAMPKEEHKVTELNIKNVRHERQA